MMLFDLHVHTCHSPCSRMTPGEILSHARSLGLDGVCLTDHDTMAVGHEVYEGIQPDGLCVIVGMEYATPQGDFLVFGPFEDLLPGMHADMLLDLVHTRRGAAIAAHPFRSTRPFDQDYLIKGSCQAVEIHNGRNSVSENRQCQDWVRRHACIMTGGSDAHTLEELGRCPTRFYGPVTTRSQLISALIQGRCEPQSIPLATAV